VKVENPPKLKVMASWSQITAGVYSENSHGDAVRKSAYVTHLREPVAEMPEIADNDELVRMISAAVTAVRGAVRARLRVVINGRVCEPSERGLQKGCPPLCLANVVRFVPRVYKSVDAALGKTASACLQKRVAVTEAHLFAVVEKTLEEIDSCDLGCVILWQLKK